MSGETVSAAQNAAKTSEAASIRLPIRRSAVLPHNLRRSSTLRQRRAVEVSGRQGRFTYVLPRIGTALRYYFDSRSTGKIILMITDVLA